jgi:transaldolase / glucose-6-phosphate isomerase
MSDPRSLIGLTPPRSGSPTATEDLARRLDARLSLWDREEAARRFWLHDPTFWPKATPEDVATRLGWLAAPEEGRAQLGDLSDFAGRVRDAGTTDVVVLGMGGSSLAPQVFAATFGPRAGYPRFHVLDSTHPAAVRDVAAAIDVAHTLFLVSSKSGTTLEPNAFFHFFWAEAQRRGASPGRQFAAITDPGTPLESLARSRGFLRCFAAPPAVGGRYSALTVFGLVPAAVIGVDLGRVLEGAARMAAACGPDRTASTNPGLALGAAIGEAAAVRRDKLTFVADPTLASFPAWGEQLVAESTGKSGTGIVPIADEVRPFDPRGDADRLIARLRIRGAPAARESPATGGTAPVLDFEVADAFEIGAEFFRWEVAVAASGVILGIDPFDQPDVELAKELAREAMRAPASPTAAGAGVSAADPGALAPAIGGWLATARGGDYAAIQAYLEPAPTVAAALVPVRAALRDVLGCSTTFGFGPRFLHSTGQLHKGGPPSGLFLQIVDRPRPELAVPEDDFSFGDVIRAQARGDATALAQKHRRVLTVDVGDDALGGLAAIGRAIRSAKLQV